MDKWHIVNRHNVIIVKMASQWHNVNVNVNRRNFSSAPPLPSAPPTPPPPPKKKIFLCAYAGGYRCNW